MNLTSEHVHWIGGFFFSVVSLSLLLRAALGWQGPVWPYLLPLLFVGYGLESIVDPWIHGQAAPADYGAESRQHLWQGAALLVAGVIEVLMLRGALTGWGWKLAMPAALVLLAFGFLFHAQHGSQMAVALMAVEHRGFAIALFVAAATRIAAVVPTGRPTVLETAWLLPLLVFGIQMLTYRESMPAMDH